MFRPKGEFIGKGCGIDMGPKSGMLRDILHTLPVVIDYLMKVFEALDVILFGNNPFHLFLLPKSIAHRAWRKALKKPFSF
jgi:hypothetical protein